MVDVGPPQADVEVTQFFGTTVVDNTGRYSVALTTLPDASRAGYELASLDELADLLDVELVFAVPTEPSALYLPHAFAAVLARWRASGHLQSTIRVPGAVERCRTR
jgi:hypothetical protein